MGIGDMDGCFRESENETFRRKATKVVSFDFPVVGKGRPTLENGERTCDTIHPLSGPSKFLKPKEGAKRVSTRCAQGRRMGRTQGVAFSLPWSSFRSPSSARPESPRVFTKKTRARKERKRPRENTGVHAFKGLGKVREQGRGGGF